MSFYDRNGNLIPMDEIGTVSPAQTTFWGSDYPSVIADNYPMEPMEIFPYKGVRSNLSGFGWQLQFCERTEEEATKKNCVHLYRVASGKPYTIIPTSSAHAFYCTDYSIADATDEQIAVWTSGTLAKTVTMTNKVKLVSTQSYGSTALFRFTPDADGYIFLPSIRDNAMLFEGATPFKVYENFVDENEAGNITNYNHLLYGYGSTANNALTTGSYGEYARAMSKIAVSDGFKKLVRGADYWDKLHRSTIRLFMIGDSITWAASNVGIDKAYRTLLSGKYQIQYYPACTNGTTITHGYGSVWGTDYETGVDGLIQAHLSECKEETEDDTRYENFVSAVTKYPIFTIALGTNDFICNAPIGTYDDTDSSTFMGGYKILIAKIRELYPESSIILCTPWKQTDWDVENEAGHVLADYNLAIHEIASKTRKCFVLDMFNNPYIVGLNDSRKGTYVDGVHLGKYGHLLIANELEKLVLQCIVLNGYPYEQMDIAEAWTGL